MLSWLTTFLSFCQNLAKVKPLCFNNVRTALVVGLCSLIFFVEEQQEAPADGVLQHTEQEAPADGVLLHTEQMTPANVVLLYIEQEAPGDVACCTGKT